MRKTQGCWWSTLFAVGMAQKEFSGKLGDEFPNIEAPSTFGDLKLHDYWGHGWGEQSASPRTLPACSAPVIPGRLRLLAPQTIHAAFFSHVCQPAAPAPVAPVGLEPASAA